MKTLTKSLLLFLAGITSIFAFTNGSPLPELEVTGIMRCVPAARLGADYHDMYGCQTAEGAMTIRQFFEKYRRDKDEKIIKIDYGFVNIYGGDNKNLFLIYYGKLRGIPFSDDDF